MVDEIEKPLVGPVQVFEDEHGRTPVGHRLDEAPPGRERLLAGLVTAVPGKPDEWSQRALDPCRVLLAEIPRHLGQLARRLFGRVGLEDSGLSLDHLAERPERDALAIGKAAALAPVNELFIGLHYLEELVDEAGFPDPRDADQRDELRLALVHNSMERSREELALAFAPYERRPALLRHVDAEAGTRCNRFPHGHGLLLSLGLDRLVRYVLDDAVGGAVRLLADEHAVDGCGRLQSGGRVEHVACRHAFASARPGSSVTSASPVLTAIRTCSSSSSRAQSRISRAARTARSGSSSWAMGAPKRATTASPMNFSTVPPKRSSSVRT